MRLSTLGRRARLGAWVLWLLAVPVASRASIVPDAQAVVKRYLAAIGGRDAVMRERAVHLKGTLQAFGLTGTIEGWNQRPDRSASLTSIGPFTIREGTAGAVAWEVDQNGKLSLRDGKDLEDARASAWFENDAWLADDQGGGSIQRMAGERDSAGTYAVLEVTPPVGRARRLWFDDRSGRLVRVVSKRDQQTVTESMLDYRTIEGRPRPRITTVEVEGMPMNRARVTLDSIWVNPSIDPSVFAPPIEAAADMRFLDAAEAVEVPFVYRTRHVWLKASINGGPPEDFLLDTGASVTVIDSAYAAAHGIASQGQIGVTGAGAAGGAAFSSLDSVRVAGARGGVVLAHQKVAVLALNPHLEPLFWRPLAGVLGYDFISRFVLAVDYDRGVLTLHDPRRFRYAGAGTAIPLTLAGNIPVVKARLNGAYEGEFRLDVGSGSSVDMHSPFVRAHDLRAKAGKSFEVTGGGFGGTFTSTLCRMKSFEIGPYRWSDPIVVLSQATTGGLASEDYAGNIGNQILERFKVTFDYDRRMVYLEPGRHYPQRDRFSMAGFQLAKLDERFEAMQVLPGSAADKAGLRPGDRVLTIDRATVASYDPETLRRTFEEGKPGERHTLEIERDGRKRRITLRLAELL
ncbi:MAG: PDZ domain-containing protein [Candidatus Eisenbacteria bacterium]|uniref:PDZ domain-containing protein n=1 Tax=Eiseniibacteriota bacterium TaxID=2212470 RepID=A0A538U0B5_UNCEI|nr:MAG: PDZ domain-containing protein [Candidatus Eisenbacteria bacterium]